MIFVVFVHNHLSSYRGHTIYCVFMPLPTTILAGFAVILYKGSRIPPFSACAQAIGRSASQSLVSNAKVQPYIQLDKH